MIFQQKIYQIFNDFSTKKDIQESLNNDIKLFQQKYNLKDQSIETFFNNSE